jgi:hypothetical protein
MRHTESESPEAVLERLRGAEPAWIPHPKAGKHPAAAKVSATGETREVFQRRHAAWLAGVEREEKLKAEHEKKAQAEKKAAKGEKAKKGAK